MTQGLRRGLLTSLAFASLALGPPWVCAATAPSDSAAAKPAGAGADSAAADTSVHVEFPRPDSTLASRLREGGYIIVFRHCITDWSQQDAAGENFEDRSAQRNLSKEGEEQATAMGKAIKALDIPILAVLSSPMWRCRDTADLAFGQCQVSVELFRRGAEYRAMRIVLLSTELDSPQNLVLITHQDLLLPIIDGLRRDQLKEGDCLVVRPRGEADFDVVAQVTPDDWAKLAGMSSSQKTAKAPAKAKSAPKSAPKSTTK